VVSRHGSASWQRFGNAILSDIGLAELSAPDGDGYVAAACRLAEDRERLAGLRAGLRDVLRHSPLCDGPARARDVEYALVW
jgi:protein O-GlcNAc transferase